jgi:CRP/FNR family cyclic AMP-dependent transcriptional regulator
MAMGKARPPFSAGRLGVEGRADLLGRTALFSGLALDQRLLLAESCVERIYKRGHLVFCEGDPGDALFVIAGGLVKIFVTSDQGDEMVLVTLREPGIFGELALVDGGPRSASAEALSALNLVVLARSTFHRMLKGNLPLMESVMKAVGQQLRRISDQTADFMFLDLYGRVAKLLLRFMEQERAAKDPGGESGVALDLHLTQSELASMVGGSRQSISQILHDFERRGSIEIKGRHVVIRDVDGLRRRAGMPPIGRSTL